MLTLLMHVLQGAHCRSKLGCLPFASLTTPRFGRSCLHGIQAWGFQKQLVDKVLAARRAAEAAEDASRGPSTTTRQAQSTAEAAASVVATSVVAKGGGGSTGLNAADSTPVAGAAAAAADTSSLPQRPDAESLAPAPHDCLVLLQHPPTYTMGTGSTPDNLLFDPDESPFPLYRTERGGEATYHGPGQLVAYPILDLRGQTKDLHWYLRGLEEAVIR